MVPPLIVLSPYLEITIINYTTAYKQTSAANSHKKNFTLFFFFDSLHLPKLSPDHLLSLSSVITPEELAGVVNLLTPKSPGPDGLPISYYNTYLLILSPHLISLYALLLKGTEPHPQFLHAHISVIPKPGKDLFPPWQL